MTSQKLPKLCRQKSNNYAYIWLDGRKKYLGKWGAEKTAAAYNLIINQLTAARPPEIVGAPKITLVELAAAFLTARADYYVKNGRQTGQLDRFKKALEYPLKYFGDQPADEIGPRRLLEIRELMEKAGRWNRPYINQLVNCFRAVYRWGVAYEMVEPATLTALQSIPALKRGRSAAREPEPVGLIAPEIVDATAAAASSVIAALIKLQRLTGMRPGEAVAITAADIATAPENPELMVYVLRTDKTAHRRAAGDFRRVFLGPRAQALLAPYILARDGEPDAPLFSPRDAAAEAALERRARAIPRRGRPARLKIDERIRDGYDVDSYRRAIYRAADRAGVERWSPNRLRHLYATEIRARYGLEAAQLMLGHARADVTQIYAERDATKSAGVALEVG